MSEIDDIKLISKNIAENTPVLFIGKYMTVFKKMYRGDIKYVNNTESVRELVSYYKGLPNLDKPLIIEDLSFLDQSASFLLLKLVEEATFPVILLSSFDRVSSIILSRVKVIKKSLNETVECAFLPAARGKEAMDEYLAVDSSEIDRLRWMAKNSPMCYYTERLVDKSMPSRDKIVKFLS